jgi:hypothetical protein
VFGAAVGALQGVLVAQNIWGFSGGVVFRSETIRIFSEAICGFILTVPAIMIGIAVRRRGHPW